MGWTTRLLVAILCQLPTGALAQLDASVDDQHHLVISASGLDLLAVEFRSPSGSLIAAEDATPFQGVVANGNEIALYYNLGTPITLDGTATLSTKWDSTKRNDVLYQYGTLLTEQPLRPIAGHQQFVDEVSQGPVIVASPDPTSPAEEIRNPSDEELLLVSSNIVIVSPEPNGIYFFDENNLSVVSLTVRSMAGLLAPAGPSPMFDILASDTPFEISYVSNSEVSLSGEFFVPAGWTGQEFEDLSFDLVTASGEKLLVESDPGRALPEPSSVAIFTYLLFGLLGWRGRR